MSVGLVTMKFVCLIPGADVLVGTGCALQMLNRPFCSFCRCSMISAVDIASDGVTGTGFRLSTHRLSRVISCVWGN